MGETTLIKTTQTIWITIIITSDIALAVITRQNLSWLTKAVPVVTEENLRRGKNETN